MSMVGTKSSKPQLAPLMIVSELLDYWDFFPYAMCQ